MDEVGSHECVACGVLLRPTTTTCPACGTDVVEGATSTRVDLDAAALLVDPGRQQLTTGFRLTGIALLVIAAVLSIATPMWWAVALAVIYVAHANLTAPRPLRASAPGRAVVGADDDLFRSELFSNGLGFLLGVVAPVAAFLTTDDLRGRVAMLVVLVSTIATWIFRSRAESDAEGFDARVVR